MCDVLGIERSLAQQSDADLVVVLQPMSGDLDKEPEHWHELVECANERATKSIDLREQLLATASRDWLAQLFWPIDQHFNPDGYRRTRRSSRPRSSRCSRQARAA